MQLETFIFLRSAKVVPLSKMQIQKSTQECGIESEISLDLCCQSLPYLRRCKYNFMPPKDI